MRRSTETLFSQRLKELRAEKGITQKQLASEIGVSYGSIVDYENGRREPNSKAMVALERYFQVSGEYLRGESNEHLEPIAPDSILLETMREDLPKRMKELAVLLNNGKDAEVELAYHVVNELAHILKIADNTQREVAMSILQDIVTAVVFFLDVCENCSRDTEAAERIEYAKNIVRPRFEQALKKSKNFLPF